MSAPRPMAWLLVNGRTGKAFAAHAYATEGAAVAGALHKSNGRETYVATPVVPLTESGLARAVVAHLEARDALIGANVNSLQAGDPRFTAVEETLATLRQMVGEQA